MKIVFFGSSKFVIPTIEMLSKNSELVLVVTTEGKAYDAVPAYCLKNKIPFISMKQWSNETMKRIQTVNAQLGILIFFGIILPKDALNIFPKGILNIHPSLLPKYRGTTPVQTAILHGEKTTGVTVMKLDDEMDHGPILVQQEETIKRDDTAETLHKRLFHIGTGLLRKEIEPYIEGKIKLKKQDHKKATYTEKLTRESGYFDNTNPPDKVKLDRMIRAYYPWPGVWTKLEMARGVLRIVKFLPNQKIQIEGERAMSYKDFTNGYPKLRDWLIKLSG